MLWEHASSRKAFSAIFVYVTLAGTVYTEQNRRHGGGWKISNSPVGWRLAGWNSTQAGQGRMPLTFESHVQKVKGDLKDIKHLHFMRHSESGKFLSTVSRKHSHCLAGLKTIYSGPRLPATGEGNGGSKTGTALRLKVKFHWVNFHVQDSCQ